METLITIQSYEGHSSVSARELHRFMQTPSRFGDWIKRALSYGFVEGEDYWLVFLKTEKNAPGGRPPTDYALTLDCAKEISMLQRSQRGAQARRYFIACERQLRQGGNSFPLEEVRQQVQRLVQQTQFLVEHTHLLTQHQQRLIHLEAYLSQGFAPSFGMQASEGLPTGGLPAVSRQQLHELVDAYCHQQAVDPKEVWDWLYRRLFEQYRINVRGYYRPPGVSLLEVTERFGHLEKLYGIAMAELNYDQYL